MNPVEFAAREQRRQADLTAAAADLTEPVAAGSMSYGGPGAWSNQAAALGVDGPVAAADLDRLVEFYTRRSIEPKVDVCPFEHETLIAGLAARGFVLREFEAVLARPLGAADEALAPLGGWPEGLEILRVDPDDAAGLADFLDASTCGFRPEGAPVPDTLAVSTERLLRGGCEGYLARIDGVPVGGGTLAVGHGVAALMGTSVRPAFRGRGIQQALIAVRLRRGLALGCAAASIQSRPGIPTERNAARLGFALVYHKVILVRPGPGLEPSP